MNEHRLFQLPKKKKGVRFWCGPTVLMLLTGKTHDQIKASVNRQRNARGVRRWKKNSNGVYQRVKLTMATPVKGMSNAEMGNLLKMFKLSPKKVTEHSYKTLREMAEDNRFVPHPIVITVTNHFVLLLGGLIYDTYTPGGQDAVSHPCARRKVKQFYIISKKAGSK